MCNGPGVVRILLLGVSSLYYSNVRFVMLYVFFYCKLFILNKKKHVHTYVCMYVYMSRKGKR